MPVAARASSPFRRPCSVHDIVGFDNDPEAVRVSGQNAALNQLAGRVRFFAGDLVTGLAGRQAELVLANIQADVLQRFAAELIGAVAPEHLGAEWNPGCRRRRCATAFRRPSRLEHDLARARRVVRPAIDPPDKLLVVGECFAGRNDADHFDFHGADLLDARLSR